MVIWYQSFLSIFMLSPKTSLNVTKMLLLLVLLDLQRRQVPPRFRLDATPGSPLVKAPPPLRARSAELVTVARPNVPNSTRPTSAKEDAGR
jgi:hypothetical protein